MIRPHFLACGLLCLPFALGSACAAESPSTATRDTLEPVYLPGIELDGFWKQQARRLTEKWLPHCIREMEAGGRGQELLNLIALGRVQRGEPQNWEYTGLPWSDAYVYNTVEAICLALSVDPGDDAGLARAQAQLRAKLEEWIPVIVAAQGSDGYVHSFHVLNGHPRYSNVGWHEFYVMGYFLEMGVAHYRMTEGNDRRLYDAVVKCADHLCATFGPAPKRTWRNGHAGLEYALCRLGRLVNEVEGAGRGDRYVQLARHFLDRQHEGRGATEYNQSDRPAIEMGEARGHAVRATYFYTAMTDMALLQGNEAYEQAADRIWENAIQRKHYLTGGVGASHNGEAFDDDYLLPNDGYCESCAGCGLSFWADRMHRLHRDAHYRDVQERVLYNNILGAIELSGENFFYQNPLTADNARYPWHACPCCVGNIPRALFGIKDLVYSLDPSGRELYLSHFVASRATLPDVGGTSLRIRQETDYPWDGQVAITLEPVKPVEFTLHIRIPDRTESELYSVEPDLAGRFTLRVNGTTLSAEVEQGYAAVRRTWKAGDRVEIALPMDVQRVRCDERVLANRGRVAIQRGPITYNVEDVDHALPVASLMLPKDAALKTAWQPDLLGGITVVQGGGLTAVPNFVRLNRGGGSQVWIVEEPDKIVHEQFPPPENLPGFAAILARTVDVVAIGDDTSEREHALKGERTSAGRAFGHRWRHAGGGWFSYQMKLSGKAPHSVFCSYWGSDAGNRRFRISVDGREVGREELANNRPGKFFGLEYPVPAELTRSKSEVTVRIQAEPGATAGGIFDLRILKSAE